MLIELPSDPLPVKVSSPERSARASRVREAIVPYLYLAPALGGVLLWVYRPLLETVKLSFYNWNLIPSDPKQAAGWSNYRQVLETPALWHALGTTGLYAVALLLFGVFLPVAIGSLSTVVRPRVHAIVRAVMFLPVLVSPVVAAAIWDFLLAPNGGVVNNILGWFGAAPINWLATAWPARLSVALISGWKIIGLATLIVMAGLMAINSDYREAAVVDGATRWQVFRQITLPLLSPTVVMLVIFTVLMSSQIVFPIINALTTGGPSGATTDIYYLLYTYGFTSFDVGLASAAAVMFFAVFSCVAIILVLLLDRFSHFDS